jgi:gluconolactonase
VNDTARQHIRVFDVKTDGSPGRRARVGRDEGRGQGRSGRHEARLASQRVLLRTGRDPRLHPEAVDLGVIRVPEYTANMAFGDDDLRSLYITASTSVYRIRVRVPGLPAL